MQAQDENNFFLHIQYHQQYYFAEK